MRDRCKETLMKVKKKGKKNGAGDGIMKHGKAANKGRI
jgi:hypothetical protein